MRQVGEETEPVARFERGQHVQRARNRRSVIDKGRKIRLHSQRNRRVLGLDLVAQLLQGSTDPEAIVRLFSLCMGCLTEPPGGGAVGRDKSLLGDGKAASLQAMQQSTHGLLAGDEVVYYNQGFKEVKTNGVDMLHNDVLLPSVDACKDLLARRVLGRRRDVNGAAGICTCVAARL